MRAIASAVKRNVHRTVGRMATLVRRSARLVWSGLLCELAFAVTPCDGAASPSDLPAAISAGVPANTPHVWHLPRGFPTPAVPADNPMSDAKIALGRRLFFEPLLSVTGLTSCASCHDPAHAFSDARPVAIGATGEKLPHSAMPLINVAYHISFGWTQPQLQSLEAQMLEPLLNEHPVEMGLAGRQQAVCAQLEADPAYRAAFAASFPQDGPLVTFDRLVKAIATFERTLISGEAPFDRYVFAGEHSALSAQAKRGMALFYSPRAGCGACHSGFNFDGNWRDAQGETGHASFANNGTSEQAMRVPTLRNIAITAPYMHDGRFVTLDAVLDHYAAMAGRIGTGNTPRRVKFDSRLRGFALSAEERSDLIAFLNALTDEAFLARYATQ